MINTTLELAAVVKVVSIRKMNWPLVFVAPLSVRVAELVAADVGNL